MPERERAEPALVGRFVAVGVVVGTVAGLGAAQAGWAAPELVGVGCLVGALLLAALVVLGSGYRPPPGPLPAEAPRAPTDRESGGLRRVERTLEDGLREVDRFNSRVRPWLVRLAEQRLRHHGAVDPHRDPETTRDLVGGTLWQLMQQPLTTVPTRQQLAEWVARIEAL